MAYAARTKVSVLSSRAELELLLLKHDCQSIAVGIDNEKQRARVEFVVKNRRIRFDLVIPPKHHVQQVRSAWRGLLLAIKAKLDSVERGIESFDEAFLAHVVMPDGRRFGEISIPQLEFYRSEGN